MLLFFGRVSFQVYGNRKQTVVLLTNIQPGAGRFKMLLSVGLGLGLVCYSFKISFVLNGKSIRFICGSPIQTASEDEQFFVRFLASCSGVAALWI